MQIQTGVLICCLAIVIGVEPQKTNVYLPNFQVNLWTHCVNYHYSPWFNIVLPPETQCVVSSNKYDIQLRIGNRIINAHRNVLSTIIPYFQGPKGFKKENLLVLEQQSLEGSAVDNLVQYAYTQNIKIDSSNAENILKAAHFLKVTEVIHASMDFLISRINSYTVTHFMNLAKALNLDALIRAAEKHWIRNFEEVIITVEFLALDASELINILKNLNTVNEVNKFEALYRWIKHDRKARSKFVYKIMKYVNFPLIPYEYLKSHHFFKELVKLSARFSELLEEAVDFHYLPDKRHLLDGCRTRAKPGYTHILVLDLGGKEIIHYNPVKPEVSVLPLKLSYERKAFALVAHNCNMYIMGGRDKKFNGFRSAMRYNTTSKTWRRVASMNRRRIMASAASADGLIYVSGGQESVNVFLSSVEAYNAHRNQWVNVAPMLLKRRGHQLLEFEQKLYAIGGISSLHQTHDTVEEYDPSTNVWVHVNAMNSRRTGFGAATHNGKIFVCGGRLSTSGKAMNSTEVYDPKTRAWKMVAPMHVARSWFSLISYGEKLWALGGDQGGTVESFDPERNRWTKEAGLTRNFESEAIAIRY